MATESLLPLFQEDGDISQLLNQDNDDQILAELLNFQGDDLLASLLEPNTQEAVQLSPQTSPVYNIPMTFDIESTSEGCTNLVPSPVTSEGCTNFVPSPVTSEGYTTDSNKAPSPASFLGDSPPSTLTEPCDLNSLLGLDNIMEPTVSSTAPSPPHDVKIDVDLMARESSLTPPLPSNQKAATLYLTEEEKGLLAEEGITLPTDMPLTKAEQKHLKRVRRKIKNKISAQESRKRKKEYVVGLEDRVDRCTQINRGLQKKVDSLETENRSLLTQLKRMQALVAKHHPTRLQAGTMMMVVVLSFSLFFVPRLHTPPSGPGGYQTVSVVRSRSLLFAETDEFGNIVDPETGVVISGAGGQTPVLPPPWTYQTPAINLINLNSSLHIRTHTETEDTTRDDDLL